MPFGSCRLGSNCIAVNQDPFFFFLPAYRLGLATPSGTPLASLTLCWQSHHVPPLHVPCSPSRQPWQIMPPPARCGCHQRPQHPAHYPAGGVPHPPASADPQPTSVPDTDPDPSTVRAAMRLCLPAPTTTHASPQPRMRVVRAVMALRAFRRSRAASANHQDSAHSQVTPVLRVLRNTMHNVAHAQSQQQHPQECRV